MATITSSFWRDANRVPITVDGITTTDSQTLTANNTTAVVPIFGFTGVVEVRALWGVVTTDLGANHTASAFRINDQTAQVYLTAVGGTTISAAKAGSLIVKTGLVATAVTYKSAAAGYIQEPTTLQTLDMTPVIIGSKTALTTGTIEYRYTTTDAPTSGAITFFIRWLPMSAAAGVTSL